MIAFIADWASFVNAIGGVLMAGFGLWVLTLTPRTRSTKLMSIFAVAAGLSYLAYNVVPSTGYEDYTFYGAATDLLAGVAGLALLGLTREVLETDGAVDTRLWRGALFGTVLFVGVIAGAEALGGFPLISGGSQASPDAAGMRLPFLASAVLLTGAYIAFLVVLALRFRAPPTGNGDAVSEQALVLTAALVPWFGVSAGVQLLWLADPTDPWGGGRVLSVLHAAGFLGLAGLWLANARARPERRREARTVGLGILVVMLAGVLTELFLGPMFPTGLPVWGPLRLFTVVALGYAILRHEVLGIETKFRFGVSKTTVAGVFLAVFFVVSEGAQVLFAGFAGSEFLGVLAAGALVFFLAPIQRAADDLAEAVVPGRVPAAGVDGPEARYRTAVEMALADGEVGRDEERNLRQLEEELDLSPTRAQEIREQVEDERDGGEPVS